MLKLVRHGDGIRRTGYYAEVAHSTKLQVVYKCVETLFLLAVFLQFLFGNDLDGAVGAGDLAGLASRTAVLVLIIMGHHHLTTKTLGILLDAAVLGVQLRYYFFMMREIVTGAPHAFEEGACAFVNVAEIFF